MPARSSRVRADGLKSAEAAKPLHVLGARCASGRAQSSATRAKARSRGAAAGSDFARRAWCPSKPTSAFIALFRSHIATAPVVDLAARRCSFPLDSVIRTTQSQGGSSSDKHLGLVSASAANLQSRTNGLNFARVLRRRQPPHPQDGAAGEGRVGTCLHDAPHTETPQGTHGLWKLAAMAEAYKPMTPRPPPQISASPTMAAPDSAMVRASEQLHAAGSRFVRTTPATPVRAHRTPRDSRPDPGLSRRNYRITGEQ